MKRVMPVLCTHLTLLTASALAQSPDDARWQAIADGPNAPVTAVASFGGQLVAGGFFNLVAGAPIEAIAAWNGSAWAPLGQGLALGGGGRGGGIIDVLSLQSFNGQLIVGGDFGLADGQPTTSVASWSGSAWTPMSGLPQPAARVSALTTYNNQVIASGVFFQGTAAFIARWTGSAWTSLGADYFTSGLSANALALAVFRGELIAGASSMVEGSTSTRVSAWNGTAWRSLASGDSDVLAMAVFGGELIVAGEFSTMGGVAARNIARFDGTRWAALGAGTNAKVQALAVLHGRLFAGGQFTASGNSPLSCVAAWDGVSWSALGSGVTNGVTVSALAAAGDDLLVGGAFTAVAGRPTSNVAVWHDPVDTTPPSVTIRPLAAAVVNTTSIGLIADVVDQSATTVGSSPAGLQGTLPPGGGTLAGTVPLANEGDNEIVVSAVDTQSLRGGTSVRVVRDTIAPELLSTTPVEATIVSASPVTITVQVRDATATRVVFGGNVVDLPAGTHAASGDVTLAEGPNAILITATDAAGNPAQTTLRLVLDTTAPVVTITQPTQGARFGPGQESVTVEATVDDLSSTLVTLTPGSGSQVLPAGLQRFTGLAPLSEGINTLQVSARDITGREGNHAVSVTLDTRPPLVTIDSPSVGAVTQGAIDFHATVVDPAPGTGVERVEFYDGSTLLATLRTAPFELTTSLADGVHGLRVVAYDQLGNHDEASRTVTVDTVDPVVQILTPADQAVVSGPALPFHVTAGDAGGTGLVAITLRVNGQAPTSDASTTYAAPVASDTVLASEDTTRWPDGPLTLTATVVDAAGRTASRSITVQVLNTAPPTCALLPANGAVVQGVVALQATVGGGPFTTVELRVDGVSLGIGTSSPLAIPFDTRLRLDGAMVIQAIVTDPRGARITCTNTVTVANLRLGFEPRTLNLAARGDNEVKVELLGASAPLLLPTLLHGLQLRVPGGSPVPAVAPPSGRDHLDFVDGVPQLAVRFSRQALAAAIRAGLQGGAIAADRDVPMLVVAEAGTAAETVLGVVSVRLAGR